MGRKKKEIVPPPAGVSAMSAQEKQALISGVPSTPVPVPITQETPEPVQPAKAKPQSVARAKRTVWVYVNRNTFPVHIPHPNDPGTTVTFYPCPDKTHKLGMLDFKLHPFYANFVGFKRSISQEPAPEYLQLTEVSVAKETGGTDTSLQDLMKMPPEKIADYIKFVTEANPDIAAQISQALAPALRKANPTPMGS